MIGIEQLSFDTTDDETIAAGSNIGAYVRAGEPGALVTYHNQTAIVPGTFVFVDGDVTVGTDVIAEVAHGFETGDKIQLTTSGVLPAGLALLTDYYVIRVDADEIKLAADLSDAEAGTAVDITAAAGGGNHTVTGEEGEQTALDVFITNKLDLDVDLDHTEDSIRLGDGSSFFTSTSENSDIALDVHISNTEIAVTQGSDTPWSIDDNGGSITVDAVQLDIDDLTFAADKVDVSGSEVSLDAATLAALETVTVLQGTDPWIIGDGGGSITVDAVDLDIRDLTHVSDSIHLGDGTDLITSTLVGSDQGLDVNVINPVEVQDIADTAILNTQKDVTVTGVLLASQLAARKYLYVQNLGAKKTYVGASGVTAADGIRLSPGAVAEFRLGPALSMHAVAESGTQDVRLMELS